MLYETVKVDIIENLKDDKLNLKFVLEDTKKFLVERINIFGNNVTHESVIRNNLALDEGDVYNEILKNKSVNNLKSLNYFKSVKSEVLDGTQEGNKIINLSIEEKPTEKYLHLQELELQEILSVQGYQKLTF